jgi:hypothetical protein
MGQQALMIVGAGYICQQVFLVNIFACDYSDGASDGRNKFFLPDPG